MGKEIERKFKIDDLPSFLVLQGQRTIIQTYLQTGNEEIRLRQTTDLIDGKPFYYLTKKVGSGLVREENEMEIHEEFYNELLKTIVSEPIIKTRSITSIMGHKIEIDMYQNEELKGLVIAEIEFNSVEEANNAQLPSWLSEDVTEDKSYKNQALWETIQLRKKESDDKKRQEEEEKRKADELYALENPTENNEFNDEQYPYEDSESSYTLEGSNCCDSHFQLLYSSTDKDWITSRAHEKIDHFDRVLIKEWVNGRVVKRTQLTSSDGDDF